MKILLDTNFLLIPVQFKVDIFAEIDRIMDEPYRLYVLEKSIEELKKIVKEQKGKHKEAANIALKLIKQKSLNTIKNSTNDSVDDIIVEIGEEYTIATQDKELKQRLKEKNIKVITLRGKKYLTKV